MRMHHSIARMRRLAGRTAEQLGLEALPSVQNSSASCGCLSHEGTRQLIQNTTPNRTPITFRPCSPCCIAWVSGSSEENRTLPAA